MLKFLPVFFVFGYLDDPSLLLIRWSHIRFFCGFADSVMFIIIINIPIIVHVFIYYEFMFVMNNTNTA